jgi:hypothetical protein
MKTITSHNLKLLTGICVLGEIAAALGLLAAISILPLAHKWVDSGRASVGFFIQHGTPVFAFSARLSDSDDGRLAYNAAGRLPADLGLTVVGPFNLAATETNRFIGIQDQDSHMIRINTVEGTLAFQSKPGTNQVLDSLELPFVLSLLCTGGLSVIILNLLRRMFQSVGRGEAFSVGNIRKLRWIGVSFLVSCFLKTLATAWLLHRMTAFAVQSLGADKVVLGSATDGDWSGLAVGLVVLALAEIFRQGLLLKEEALLTV